MAAPMTTMTDAQRLALGGAMRSGLREIPDRCGRATLAALIAKRWVTERQPHRVTPEGERAWREAVDVTARRDGKMAGARGSAEVSEVAVANADNADMGRVASIFEVGKLTGRMEMAGFLETVSGKAMVETYLKVKEGKKYQGLPYRKPSGETGNVSSLEEFCEVFLGKTGRRVRQIESQYNLLGPELYERAEAIGLSSRDYAAIKALPAHDQEVIKTAMADETTKDEVLDLLQELAARAQREKEAAKKREDELSSKLDASVALGDQDRGELRRVQAELVRIQKYTPEQARDERVRQIIASGQGIVMQLDTQLGLLSACIGYLLTTDGGELGSRQEMAVGWVAYVVKAIEELLDQWQIRIDLGEMLDPGRQAEVLGLPPGSYVLGSAAHQAAAASMAEPVRGG